jgi:hypothetical protein
MKSFAKDIFDDFIDFEKISDVIIWPDDTPGYVSIILVRNISVAMSQDFGSACPPSRCSHSFIWATPNQVGEGIYSAGKSNSWSGRLPRKPALLAPQQLELSES